MIFPYHKTHAKVKLPVEESSLTILRLCMPPFRPLRQSWANSTIQNYFNGWASSQMLLTEDMFIRGQVYYRHAAMVLFPPTDDIFVSFILS